MRQYSCQYKWYGYTTNNTKGDTYIPIIVSINYIVPWNEYGSLQDVCSLIGGVKGPQENSRIVIKNTKLVNTITEHNSKLRLICNNIR